MVLGGRKVASDIGSAIIASGNGSVGIFFKGVFAE
jgi:hypothetical protein